MATAGYIKASENLQEMKILSYGLTAETQLSPWLRLNMSFFMAT